MKLIYQYTSLSRAQQVSSFLEGKGIKTFVSSIGSYQLGGVRTGAITVGLWVVYNYQMDDAIACLKNKKHKVLNPLSKQELVKPSIRKRLTKEQASIYIIKGGLKILLLLGLLGYLLYIIII